VAAGVSATRQWGNKTGRRRNEKKIFVPEKDSEERISGWGEGGGFARAVNERFAWPTQAVPHARSYCLDGAPSAPYSWV